MVIINGISYIGNNVSVSGNRIIIDGKDVTPDVKTITIQVDGNIDNLSVDACNSISITGSVGKIKTMSGDVNIDGDVQGNVETMSGDVDAFIIHGSVKTVSGDIHKK